MSEVKVTYQKVSGRVELISVLRNMNTINDCLLHNELIQEKIVSKFLLAVTICHPALGIWNWFQLVKTVIYIFVVLLRYQLYGNSMQQLSLAVTRTQRSKIARHHFIINIYSALLRFYIYFNLFRCLFHSMLR